jgi:hypothetical protein
VKLFAVLAAALVAAGAASAAQAPIRVVGFASIGPFKVHGGTVGSARAAFGRPSRIHATTSACDLIWAGLKIQFYSLAHENQCRADTNFGQATLTRPWVTDRGLRQGDPVAKARKLYPRALKPHFAGSGAIGLVVKLSQALGDYGLAATVVNGRVAALVISDPQGGE